MDRPRFVIEASEAESMAKQSGKETVHDLLPSLVKWAQSLARPAISNYQVGAVGIGPSGRVFFGVNLEFPGLPLHHSVHAEQFLVTNLALNAEPSLTHLAVSSAPCGHCRQFLQELRRASDINIHITDRNEKKSNVYVPLHIFLPNRFGPDDLLDKDVPLLLERHQNQIGFTADLDYNTISNNHYQNHYDCDTDTAALQAAKESHAPYSRCPSGVALMDCDGNVYRGSYTESAAYNPSLGPVQAALVAYLVGSCGTTGGAYERIVEAVLVEKDDAVVKQEATARLLLQAVAPKCVFKVVHCCDVNKKRS